MARNRKRAKERRARQPVASGRVRDAAASSVGDAAATSFGRENQNGEAGPEVLGEPGLELATDGAPDPIAHAAPDAEVAEARIARAGVEVAAEPGDEIAAEADDEIAVESDGAPAGSEISDETELAPVERARAGTVAPSPWLGARLLAFLEGSWRELHRVQWPDRRQVLQATGVVIGFVIVAAVFLGVADLVASKVVNFVIYGK